MKKLIALIAAALSMGVLSPVEARAGHQNYYVSHHSRGLRVSPQIFLGRGGPVIALSFGGSRGGSYCGRDYGYGGQSYGYGGQSYGYSGQSYGYRGQSYGYRGHGHKRHRHGHRH